VSNDAVSEHDRHGVPILQTCPAPDQCSCAAVRGLEVSLGSLGQYELVQGEIGNSPAKTLVNLHLADCVNASLALPDKHINLP
jgi:hypothetical protein